ncbi:uncharacterized protein MYCFIDRAFT_213861 [Pseudocercospora fijiensis CIRAD86]|uniref:DUF1772 domain-containing protein n=1 Tax=Pseudocercospora fijiensis (strain CIRAD86) TaxID=383855 RepID=M3B7X3_PSEFD|nr:uncharacterized protein MYCFIDRAFT_213861 [Pseudocercospora fijiensis CIRAD86]EME85423.1 hypothetical protein MYCFIDRAFT_213861 [Pseudocercospora fijiensis CIRAD86]
MPSPTLSQFWWMTPIQFLAALTAGFNSGATGLQAPLTMPILELSSIPAVYRGKQLRHLLTASDKFFPKLNAVSTLSNLVLGVICFLKRKESRVASEKWKFLVLAFGLNFGTTVFTLGYMARLNDLLRELARKIEVDPSDGVAERRFGETQVLWKRGANFRTVIMTSAAAVSIYTLYLDGKYLGMPM